MLAPVKPINWNPPGTRMKLIAVAIRPIAVMAPKFSYPPSSQYKHGKADEVAQERHPC
jgi:hypothetical protein